MPLILRKARIQGFRAFEDTLEVNLSPGITVLLGPVGSGKTSFLKAIEYGLFGTTSEVRRKVWKKSDLINDFSEYARIELLLEDSDEHIHVERQLRKDGRETLTIKIGEEEYTGANAQRVLEEKLKLGHEGFTYHIFLNYRNLQDVIYGSPSARATALDRLFGIEELEDVFRSISLSAVVGKIKEEEGRRKALQEQLDALRDSETIEKELENIESERGALVEKLEALRREYAEVEKTLTEKEEKARKYHELRERISRIEGVIEHYTKRYGEEELEEIVVSTVSVAKKLREALIAALETVYEADYAQKLSELPIERLGIEEIIRNFRDVIETLERGRARLQEELHDVEGELSFKVRELERLKREYAKMLVYVEEWKELASRVKRYEKKHRNVETLRKRIDKLKIKLEKEKEARRELVCRALIHDLLLKAKKPTCPICGQEIENRNILKERYKEELTEIKAKRGALIDKMERKIASLEKELKEWEELNKRLAELEKFKIEAESLKERIANEEDELKELEETAEEYREMIREVEEALRSSKIMYRELYMNREKIKAVEEIERNRSLLNELKKEIEALDFNPDEYEALKNRLTQLKLEIAEVQSSIERLEEEAEILRQDLERSKELRERIEELEDKISSLRSLHDKLLKVKNTFRKIQASTRRYFLEEIGRKMNEAFRAMYTYGDYDALDIRVIETRRRGGTGYERSLYEIYARRTRDGEWVSILPRLSDGQKAVIALILSVALFNLSRGNIGFILLDEPAPNVDENLKKSLVKGIKELGIQQVILATQSRSIVETEDVRVIELKGVEA